MSIAIEEERDIAIDATMRPIGHLSLDGEHALCGAFIFGIPAFGDYDECVVCNDLWPFSKETRP